jgi:hypothetical protein
MGVHWSQVFLVLGAFAFVSVIFGLLAVTILRSTCTQYMERGRTRRAMSSLQDTAR